MTYLSWFDHVAHMFALAAADEPDKSWFSPATIVSVLGALGVGGLLTAFLTLGPTRRKIREEAESIEGSTAQVLTSSAISLLNPMREQIDSLNKQLSAATTHVELLKSQVRSMGEVPVDGLISPVTTDKNASNPSK